MVDRSNVSGKIIELRFKEFPNVFDKDADNAQPPAGQSAPTPSAPADNGLTPLRAYEARYLALRAIIQDLAVPRLKQVFRERAKHSVGNKFPHCQTVEQFLNEYRTGVYDNKKRWMVHVLTNLMWMGTCMAQIEAAVMKKLGLKYKDVIFCEQTGKLISPKTRRLTGSIKIMINRMKQTLFIERFRYEQGLNGRWFEFTY